MTEPQERPERGNDAGGVMTTPRRAVAQQETRDVAGPDALPVDCSAALKRGRQAAPHLYVALDGLRGKPPFGLQVAPVALQERPGRPLRNSESLPGDRACAGQVAHQRAHAGGRDQIPVSPAPPVLQEHGHLAVSELRQRDALALRPPAQIREQLQMSARTRRPVAAVREFFPEARQITGKRAVSC